jgi:dihydrofolate synthase / folylpolyglutamate synthase
MALNITPLKTRVFLPGDDLVDFVFDHLPGHKLATGSVLAITSKIVSLAENRVHDKSNINKHDLAREDAEIVVGDVGYNSLLTVTRGVMILSAGIDESNSPDNGFILYPLNPGRSLLALYTALAAKIGHTQFGMIMTDSRSAPLRNGVTGVALACCGFHGAKSRIGNKDIFGRPLKSTIVNIADSLAAACVVMMGEADEQQPLALISGADIEFVQADTTNEIAMTYSDDLYQPLLAALRAMKKD